MLHFVTFRTGFQNGILKRNHLFIGANRKRCWYPLTESSAFSAIPDALTSGRVIFTRCRPKVDLPADVVGIILCPCAPQYQTRSPQIVFITVYLTVLEHKSEASLDRGKLVIRIRECIA